MIGDPGAPFDRYRSVGLRQNPFAADGVDAHDVDVFVDRGLGVTVAPGGAVLVQFIGDKGVGKSTHLHRLRSGVAGPYHYVPRSPRRARAEAPPVGPIVYADELDRLAAPTRAFWFRKMARAKGTIVAGTHCDLAAPARRAGLAVITHHLGPANLETLTEFVDRRFAAVALGPERSEHLCVQSRLDLEAVHRRSGGNLRAAEGILHELVADCVAELVARRPAPGATS